MWLNIIQREIIASNPKIRYIGLKLIEFSKAKNGTIKTAYISIEIKTSFESKIRYDIKMSAKIIWTTINFILLNLLSKESVITEEKYIMDKRKSINVASGISYKRISGYFCVIKTNDTIKIIHKRILTKFNFEIFI